MKGNTNSKSKTGKSTKYVEFKKNRLSNSHWAKENNREKLGNILGQIKMRIQHSQIYGMNKNQ
jgi:hypothetical protein